MSCFCHSLHKIIYFNSTPRLKRIIRCISLTHTNLRNLIGCHTNYILFKIFHLLIPFKTNSRGSFHTIGIPFLSLSFSIVYIINKTSNVEIDLCFSFFYICRGYLISFFSNCGICAFKRSNTITISRCILCSIPIADCSKCNLWSFCTFKGNHLFFIILSCFYCRLEAVNINSTSCHKLSFSAINVFRILYFHTADKASKMRRLASLQAEYQVHPGHGESTTLNREKGYNPYLR